MPGGIGKRALAWIGAGGAAILVLAGLVEPRIFRGIARRVGIHLKTHHRSPTTGPVTSAGWLKSSANPVLGGDLGTCFDAVVLKEGATFRMWFSWRPRKSIALAESSDGIHWSSPVIALGPELATGWEAEFNRPGVLQRNGSY